ncbi:MAG: hypothetical protein WC598_05230 [Methanoregula sp.]
MRENRDSMSRTTKTTGRPRRISRAKMGDTSLSQEKRAEQENTGLARRSRSTGTDTEVVIHPPTDLLAPQAGPGRTRSNPIVYEAMDLLRTYGYSPARMIDPSIPVNIIGLKKSGTLLVCAIRSRLPVPNAAKLYELFTGKVDCLCGMARRIHEQIMIWVYSPACGWRYYLVYPGGLRFDLDFPASLDK